MPEPTSTSDVAGTDTSRRTSDTRQLRPGPAAGPQPKTTEQPQQVAALLAPLLVTISRPLRSRGR